MHLTAAMPLLAMSTWKSKMLNYQCWCEHSSEYKMDTWINYQLFSSTIKDIMTKQEYIVIAFTFSDLHTNNTIYIILQFIHLFSQLHILVRLFLQVAILELFQDIGVCNSVTFSMTLLPPKRVTNSAGEATVKSLCRSKRLRSRPCFTRCSPDMLGLFKEIENHIIVAWERISSANNKQTTHWLSFSTKQIKNHESDSYHVQNVS